MCGIAGILGNRPDLGALRRMTAALHHRGPDEFGLYRDQGVGLVHTRLSIIDLASGQQPMTNEDGSIQVVFNGEIFNYVELREELIAKGHVFKTKSDTEVIVHGFEAWGLEAFARFNGQFAIALWDGRRLVLARDRLGVRPIHWAEHDGYLYFASEIKAIFAGNSGISRALDPLGLDETFTFWASLAPRTPFAAVRELPPGHLMMVEDGKVSQREWYVPTFAETFRGSIDEAAEAVHAALDEATRLRVLRADVPVGSYLSGGLDSSFVAALAIRRREGRLATFSLRFEDAEYDETGYQRQMSKLLESEHHEIVVSKADIARVFPDVVRHTERPILRTAPAPLFMLSGLVQSLGTKVVLTGEGADEMFGGYDLFREAKVRQFWAKQPESKSRPLLLQRLYPYLARSPVAEQAMARKFFGRKLEDHLKPGFSHEPRWHSTSAVKRLFSKGVREAISSQDAAGALVSMLPPGFDSWSKLAKAQYLEIRTLLSPYILCSQGDRMLMAHSVEGRFPFLDPNVVALAHSLPARYKLNVLDEKHVLKRAAKGLVPEEILARPKQPYRAPDALSFAGEDWVADEFTPAAIEKVGAFDPGVAGALYRKCAARKNDAQLSNTDNMALVGVLSTHLLVREVAGAAAPDTSKLQYRTFIDRISA